MQSLTPSDHAYIGYTQTWNTYIGTPLNNYFATGPMSKTTQNFNWTETISWPPKF
jgi:hypothetical protein